LPAAEIERKVLALTGCASPRTVAHHAQTFGFTVRADETVPIALACALEANSWADAVKNACHIGGDSDTIACMAGAIAEARFGLPRQYALEAWEHLTPEMHQVIEAFYASANRVLPTSPSNLVVDTPPLGSAPADAIQSPQPLLKRFLAWLAAQ
jgi:hypothetical protein